MMSSQIIVELLELSISYFTSFMIISVLWQENLLVSQFAATSKSPCK